ncbi:MAG TPA: hypothetical protein DDX39_11375 [Bacteroidales bacterium]|nr:hypothetical protein [Bacteroidales bacterium]
MKTNYFYIDETGHINNDEPIFAYGCIKTDTPKLIEKVLEELKEELAEDSLLAKFGEKILKNNFHATEDHFDARTQFYRILPLLNYRAYFIVLFKNDDYFKRLKKENADHEIIKSMLLKIIKPRITRNRGDKNVFYIETLEVQNKSLKAIVEEIFNIFKDDYNVEYSIVDKHCQNMPIVDYLCFILNKIFVQKENENKTIDEWVTRTFETLQDKIALIHFLNEDSFFSRQAPKDKQIELNNLKLKRQCIKDK